jgi:membrane-associated phospholipid phosphatase
VASMDAAAVQRLDPNHLNFLDRPVAFLDPAGFDKAQKKSDLFLNVCLFTPVVLALDKNIRKDWLDLITLYLASHAVDNAIYFAVNYSIRRPRPLVYNPNLPLSEKTGEAKSNSFFSGHTSFSTTATFFVAKIYTDYHQIKGWKRALIYTGAAIPAALVGYYRMEAGKHFRTDILVGMLSGAASGILVPELHKFRKKQENISFAPYFTPGASGLTVMVGL